MVHSPQRTPSAELPRAETLKFRSWTRAWKRAIQTSEPLLAKFALEESSHALRFQMRMLSASVGRKESEQAAWTGCCERVEASCCCARLEDDRSPRGNLRQCDESKCVRAASCDANKGLAVVVPLSFLLWPSLRVAGHSGPRPAMSCHVKLLGSRPASEKSGCCRKSLFLICAKRCGAPRLAISALVLARVIGFQAFGSSRCELRVCCSHDEFELWLA